MRKSVCFLSDSEIPSEGQRALAAATLERSVWFGKCRPATRDMLLGRGLLRVLHKGEALTHQGSPVDQLCLVIEGSLAVSVTTRTGKRHVVNYLEPGQLMNLIPVLDEQPAIHDATAHTTTLVLLMDRAQIQEALLVEPGLVHTLMRLLCLRARHTYQVLTGNTTLPLAQRCAAALLNLAAPYGLPRSDGLVISLKLSQDEFADMVGCSRPMANRELKQMESQGWIRMTYSHFAILDLEALRGAASA